MLEVYDKIVIFGASVGAAKVVKMIQSLGKNIEFLVDNDVNKHGKIIEGLEIKSPKELLNHHIEYKVIIASMYHEEIEEQLTQMGINKKNIVLKENYILEYLNGNKDIVDFNSLTIRINNTNLYDKTIFDLLEGLNLGGIEKWSITVANALTEQNKTNKIFTIKDAHNSNVKSEIVYFDLDYEHYMCSVQELVRTIVDELPCTIIINRINQLFMAAYLVKKYFPEQIQIVSILHSDFVRMYEQHVLVQEYLDRIICVSNDVAEKLTKKYKVDSSKVYYKDSPIVYEEKFKKHYSNITEPIVIGYGARLEKAQKRADLLIPFIERLESRKINYTLSIAGEGSLYNLIKGYVKEKALEHKVILQGRIPFDKMNDFWKKCDVFINLSDIEGIGLSMLEAMSLGVVPVVTNTAGAGSFITNGVNGYVNPIRDIDGIVNCICDLDINREKLELFGNASRNIIRDRCGLEEYLKFFVNVLKSLK